MTQKTEFYRHPTIFRSVICTAVIALFACAADAAVVSRGAATSARPSVTTRGNATTGRMPTTTVSTTTDTNTTTTTNNQSETTTSSDATDTSDDSDEMVIENRSSYFDEILSESSTSNTDTSAATLAELVAAQRAELDAQDAIATANTVLSGNQNACDVGLRACMREKCGNDFTGCSGDTDTMWGNKMDSCRNDIDATCTGEEYRLFAAEIKSDRDINARLASYNAILDCGNRYNDCIMTECGVTFSKCLGKSAGDAAIAKCETIANNCIEQDSGLASRAMQVFANLRVDAEEQVMRDEERLYELRDQMANQCQTLGAMFDERTFSCVYTVNFYAGDDSTLYASKKAYAGDVFDCTPNWFGIDITTFMENAYRLTREQTSASSALLGSGLGVAAGAITSGAIDRAIDRHKAEKALKDAQDEYDENYGSDDSDTDGDKKASTKDKKSDDKKSCIEPILSQEDAQQEIAELQENANAMKEREQSLANKLIGGAAIGAMGIGGMQLASAMAEQNADTDAEMDMAAYLATFRCDYGAGRNITGGETNIQLPGANTLLPIYNEYTTLAADLKLRKESLGMAPGIESEVILDAATSGLYDNESVGITGGAYTSLSRALSDPSGADAAAWAAQRAETQSQLTTGAIVAGAGALVGIAGNVLANYVGDKPREMSDEIRAKYEPLKKLHDDTVALPNNEQGAQCPSGTTGTFPNCVCPDATKQVFNTSSVACDTCPGDQVVVNNQCACPDGTVPGENDTCVTPTTDVEPQCDETAGHVTVNPDTGQCTCTDGYVLSSDALPKCECPELTHELNTDGQCVIKQPVLETEPITLPAQNLFALGSANLTNAAQQTLQDFVTDFNAQFAGQDAYCIKIVGNTDTTGSDKRNAQLSKQRADAVKSALSAAGLSATNMYAVGAGAENCTETTQGQPDDKCRNVTVTATNAACPRA